MGVEGDPMTTNSTSTTNTSNGRKRLAHAIEQAKVEPQRRRRDQAASPWANAPRRRFAA
jgi:hypothetical protein